MRLLLLLAALGGTASSVDADRVKMQGALLRIQSAQSYTLHEIQSAAGISVREYVSSSGDVFGVAWSGPAMPDLQQVLGTYFTAYQQAVQEARRTRRARGPIAIDTGDLVVQVSGHMRSFTGRAYVKHLMPPTVDPSAVR
ncbi:MAG TPA: DUF2844 domain-containing protein [Vicinamibacterales bacterium]|nr:DUF2844 domain-containing protein [Vicinamibacterales bacterium]